MVSWEGCLSLQLYENRCLSHLDLSTRLPWGKLHTCCVRLSVYILASSYLLQVPFPPPVLLPQLYPSHLVLWPSTLKLRGLFPSLWAFFSPFQCSHWLRWAAVLCRRTFSCAFITSHSAAGNRHNYYINWGTRGYTQVAEPRIQILHLWNIRTMLVQHRQKFP